MVLMREDEYPHASESMRRRRQGAAKRYQLLLAAAVRSTLLDPTAVVAFDAAVAASAAAAAAQAAGNGSADGQPGRPTPPPDSPARGLDTDVPIVFSPLVPCAPDRRAQLLASVRQACAAAGARAVWVLDAGGCLAGALPAGAEAVPLDGLLSDPECGAVAGALNRSYLHLSSNTPALE